MWVYEPESPGNINDPVAPAHDSAESRESLFESLGLNKPIMKDIVRGKIFGVEPSSTWRKPFMFFTDQSISGGFGAPLPPINNRCPVYTYFEPTEQGAVEGESQVLEAWKKAWWAYGFKPVVLNATDCKKSPRYEQFMSDNKISEDFKYMHKKWFAWLGNDAGIYADRRVVPLPTTSEARVWLKNLRDCKFDRPTKYEGMDLDFIHGDITKIQRLLNSLMAGEAESSVYGSFEDAFRTDEQPALAHYTNHNLNILFSGRMSDRLSLYDAPSKVASIMNVHAHHEFLRRYPKGVAVVDPFVDFYDDDVTVAAARQHPPERVFSLPAKHKAEHLMKCPSASDVVSASCPPLPAVLEFAQSLKENDGITDFASPGIAPGLCGNPCADGQSVKYHSVSSLPLPGSGMYTIIGVPHPLTALAILDRKKEPTTLDARKRLTRDVWLRQFADNYVPLESTSNAHRLFMGKDAIISRPTESNTTWFIWESETPERQQMIDWDLGFSTGTEKWSTQEVKSANLREILGHSRNRVLSPDRNDQLRAIEAWNMADTELWRFLYHWQKQKDDELAKISG
ncbi:hypothetical protein TRVA0_003S01552 [Trichomonascus vanleenenianus]|uniref:uncharacterized protein n=1 Tax=Trichomonascus vanleenenianus TaxID=2268995 RepID=UPI003ECA758A